MERQYVWLDEFSCTFGEIVHQLVQQHGQQPKVKEKNYVEEEKQDERKEQYGLVESGVGFYQQLQSQIHKEVETHLQQTVCIQQLECKQKNKMQQSFIHQKTKSLLKSRQLEQDPSSIRIAVFNALADGLAQFGQFFFFVNYFIPFTILTCYPSDDHAQLSWENEIKFCPQIIIYFLVEIDHRI